MNTLTELLQVATIARMKTEILKDMQAGTVPANVRTFGDLHDYVDANEYGGFCVDGFADGLILHFGGRNEAGDLPDGFVDFMNECQTAVSQWLTARADRLILLDKTQQLALVEQALDAACAVIQQGIGQTDGGIAGLFFTGENRADFFDLMMRYIYMEYAMRAQA